MFRIGKSGAAAGFALSAQSMISVLIEAENGQEEGLARTLHSLVSAAVEGVVREVIVCSTDNSPDIAKVADHAGCRMAQSLGVAVEAARGEWLLVVEPGARLFEGWTESVLAHASGGGRPARFTSEGWARWLPRAWARPYAGGLLIRRSEAQSLRSNGAFRPRVRTKRLAARLAPAR